MARRGNRGGQLTVIERTMESRIDITGNWHEGDAFFPHVQVREPDLAGDEERAFHQQLVLPRGEYRVEFEYEPALDRAPGHALGKSAEPFLGLRVNGTPAPLYFHEPRASWPITVGPNRIPIDLELSLRNTRVMRTWLVCPGDLPTADRYCAVGPDGDGEALVAHGVPFLSSRIDFVHIPAELASPGRHAIRPFRDGMEFHCGGVAADALHFLGMIHSIDLANGSWFSLKGDHGYSHFAGDQAGQIVLHFADGQAHHIPLIFGWNLWYSRPWDILWAYEPYAPAPAGRNCDAEMFGVHNEHRDAICDGLALVDGIRLMGARSCNARFVFSVLLSRRPLNTITLHASEAMHGYPLVSAITIETKHNHSGLRSLPNIGPKKTALKTVALKGIERRDFEPGVERIKRTLYTFVDELPRLDRPQIPANYFGPRFNFLGSPEAIYAASFLYRNGPECASHIADGGTTCASKTAARNLSHYTLGTGVWREEKPALESIERWFELYRQHSPGTLLKNAWPGFTPSAWSRGAGELLRESIALGYDKFADTYVDWMDHCLLTEANPPHWNRVLGEPNTCTTLRKVGATIEQGNRENDGHGICMWGRYMQWHWGGRLSDWNERHWPSTEAAVEWIQWQLETDTIFPGSRKDVLYTESECAHGSYDIYSSYNCLHGLKLSIRLARQIGQVDCVRRWTQLYHRLRQGILDHLVDQTPDGPVWHTETNCEWQDHAHKLVHLHLSTEGDSYTPLQDYSAGDEADRSYLDISRNSYCALMKQRDYDCLRMLGYGQGMMIQAALLLDEMADAEQFIATLVKHVFLPRLGGWACPEGIIRHRSGNFYLPVNGYLGQDSHVADSVKALRLTLGVDDNDPNHLRLIPRYPASWTQVSVTELPALIDNRRNLLRYEFTREPTRWRFHLELERHADRVSIRLGPMSPATRVCSVQMDRKPISFRNEHSGDSRWIWISDLSGDNINVIVQLR